MDSWNSYPSIFALGHRAIKDLFEDEIIIEEKVDGSQFSFGIFADPTGKLVYRMKSKRVEVYEDSNCMFQKAIEVVKGLDLVPGYTYRCEYLSKPKHNTLCYERTPKDYLILFDINTGLECYMGRSEKVVEAARLGLEVVPLLYTGKVDDPEFIIKLLEIDSILGGSKVEGVVIKNYERFGIDKKILIGKYVSEAFKEMNHSNHKKSNKAELITILGQKYKTDARWQKAVQHLREDGRLGDNPRDIGHLIKEVHADIEKECTNEIKEMLFKHYFGKIKRVVTSGFPEWYKEQLLNKQFENEDVVENMKLKIKRSLR